LAYKLLEEFRELFAGKKYEHRISTHGDRIASFLYEDLFDLGRSPKIVAAVSSQSRVLNTANVAVGKKARRGDGTFGERVPHIVAVAVPDFSVALGEVATIEIGTEVKILAKAMRKQLDRVCTDLFNQVSEFKRHGGNPICVGIVGVNSSQSYTGYEGTRRFKTDGKANRHPFQEADKVARDLVDRVASKFDEFLILRFKAENIRPYKFFWVDQSETEKLYASALVRISRAYETRF